MEIRKQKGKQVGRLTVTDKQHQEDLQRLRLLRPIDDDFMRCLFKDNIPLAEFVLRIITDKPDLIITECETQKDMKRLAGARSICLDAYGTDSVGKKYDLEVQRQDKGADPHRARYHSSVMDVVDRYLDYFTTIMEDRLWQVLAKPVFRWRNRSGLSMNAARAA